MFKTIQSVSTPPEEPTMVWDGKCGFCEYWITVWRQKTGTKIKYVKYQEVYERFPSISLKEFKKAAKLIEIDGKVFSGPDSAFRSFLYFPSPIKFLHSWYHKYGFFQRLSNKAYIWIAKHRPFMFKLTKLLWGTNPRNRKPFWLEWFLLLLLIIYGINFWRIS
jgi:predicted DCC family thiol-disulfide oxidoreductase YuxK